MSQSSYKVGNRGKTPVSVGREGRKEDRSGLKIEYSLQKAVVIGETERTLGNLYSTLVVQ